MIKHFQISSEKICPSSPENSTIQVFINPDEKEKQLLIQQYSLDEHTLQSALDPDESARIEFEPNHIAIIFKRPTNLSGREQFMFKASTLGSFLFQNRVVILMNNEMEIFEGKIFARSASLMDVVLKLLYRSIFHFMEHLKVINLISEELEQKINQAMENRYLINLFALEKSLVYYLNAIASNGVLIERLKHNAPKLGLNQEQIELLDDIQIENQQCYKQAEIYSHILASLMDARASIVNNNLNVLMKTLNIITIAIMVPTMVVSIFSMNVKLPLQAYAQAFWIIMAMAVASAVSVFLIWWRRR